MLSKIKPLYIVIGIVVILIIILVIRSNNKKAEALANAQVAATQAQVEANGGGGTSQITPLLASLYPFFQSYLAANNPCPTGYTINKNTNKCEKTIV